MSALDRIYEYCYPSGCLEVKKEDMVWWDPYTQEVGPDPDNIFLPNYYKTDAQKRCGGAINPECLDFLVTPKHWLAYQWKVQNWN